MRKKIFLMMFFLFGLTGCASIVGKTNESVLISTNVPDAKITITDKNQMPVWGAKSPTAVNLKKKAGYFSGQTYTIMAHKDGYRPAMMILDTELSGWYWGNIIFGGLIGMLLVDPLTGSMWTFENNSVYLNLDPLEY